MADSLGTRAGRSPWRSGAPRRRMSRAARTGREHGARPSAPHGRSTCSRCSSSWCRRRPSSSARGSGTAVRFGDDYSGDGRSDVVIQVHDGDSTTAIGQTLQDHKVVATVQAFVNAAARQCGDVVDPARLLQDAHRDSGRDAVARLTDPQNRVGKLVIPEGRQLDDVQDVKTNAVTDGIFTPDLQRHLRGPRRRPTLRVGGRPAAGSGQRRRRRR